MTTAHEQSLTATWRQIAAKIDGFFEKVAAKHGEQMNCRLGCAACCGQELSVMLIEALALVYALEALPAAEQRALAQRASSQAPPCVFLVEGACSVYEGRPMICRSHGLPIRQDGEVHSCDLNFRGNVPADSSLDSGWVTATLTIANGLLAQKLGISNPDRVALRDIAAHGRAALPEALCESLADNA